MCSRTPAKATVAMFGPCDRLMAAPTSDADIPAHRHRAKQAESRKADEDAHYRRGARSPTEIHHGRL